MLKHNYIIYYNTINGNGYCDYKDSKKIKNSKDLALIQDKMNKHLCRNVNITGFNYMGWSWK